MTRRFNFVVLKICARVIVRSPVLPFYARVLGIGCFVLSVVCFSLAHCLFSFPFLPLLPSSFQIFFNVFGYFLSPTLSGAVMAKYDLKTGFQLVLLWSIFGGIFIVLAYIASVMRATEYEARQAEKEKLKELSRQDRDSNTCDSTKLTLGAVTSDGASDAVHLCAPALWLVSASAKC